MAVEDKLFIRYIAINYKGIDFILAFLAVVMYHVDIVNGTLVCFSIVHQ